MDSETERAASAPPPRPARPREPQWSIIPDALKAIAQWVGWRYELANDRWTKVLCLPSGRHASSTDESTWSSFESVRNAYLSSLNTDHPFDGVGFALKNGIIAFDFDHVIDLVTGKITDPTVERLVKILGSYTEKSPSGTGLRVLAFGKLPDKDRKEGPIEMYESARFVTITGDHLADTPLTINQRRAQIMLVHQRVFAERNARRAEAASKPVSTTPISASDQEQLERARESKEGAKFKALYDRGDWKGQAYASQSEADLALCMMLRFWLGADAGRIDAAFRRSALYREKWDRADYRDRTIDQALPGDVYMGSTSRNGSAHAKKTAPAKEAPPDAETPIPDEMTAEEAAERSEQQNIPEPEELPGKYSDDQLASDWVDARGEDFRFVRDRGVWFHWDGQRWAKDDETVGMVSSVRTYLHNLAERVWEEAKNAAAVIESMIAQGKEDELEGDPDPDAILDAGRKTVKALRSRAKTHSVADFTSTDPRVWAATKDFDRYPHLLNTPDGVYNLDGGAMGPHSRELYLTQITAVSPAPEGTHSERWEKFLDVSLGGQDEQGNDITNEKIAFLKRAAGYSTSGDMREHRWFFNWGPKGRNGKGVFYRSVMAVLGDYADILPSEALLASDQNRHPQEWAGLKGKRFIVVEEIEGGRDWKVSKINEFTGRTPQKVHFMHENDFVYDPEGKLWAFANNKPKFPRGAASPHTKWRFQLIEWLVNFRDPATVSDADDSTDPIANLELEDQLKPDLPAILRWLVDGYSEWRKEGLKPPEAVSTSSKAYIEESDDLKAFAEEWLKKTNNSDDKLPSREAFLRWTEWAESRKTKVGEINEFSQGLKNMGFTYKRRTGFRGFLGVKLTDMFTKKTSSKS